MIEGRVGEMVKGKAAVLDAMLATLVATGLLLIAAGSAHGLALPSGGSFTVNQTTDLADANPGDGACDTSGAVGSQCTLRAAIQEANALSGADAINFNIGGGIGVKTIAPASALPTITDAVTIDGYSQPGATKNTNTAGAINANPLIEINGANAGNTDGLFLSVDSASGSTSAGSVVKGLVINRFQDCGISVGGTGSVRIEGNFIGTDPAGTQALRNGSVGVNLKSENVLGGTAPEARNLISGNRISVTLNGRSNKVQGNLIGTAKDGTSPLGNDFGMGVNGLNNTVGGTEPGTANTIAFSGGYGVFLTDFNALSGNRVLSNSIFSNGGLGIDLDGDGPTPNDRKDPDTGANNLQNFPVITSAAGSSNSTTITGTLDSRPRKTFIVQFFSNSSGSDEGEVLLGQKTAKTNRKGKASFSFTLTGDHSARSVTATATNDRTGDTSEFSAPVTVS